MARAPEAAVEVSATTPTSGPCAPRLAVPDPAISRAHMQVDRAAWAAAALRRLDRGTVLAVAEAVAAAAHERAAHYAEWAVRESGFGVVEHKTIKNRLCAHPLLDHYRALDLVSPRVDAERGIVELPKPAGVVLALAPATNPIATVYYKTMLAVLSRNAVVLSPHPAAAACSADAAAHLAAAAEAAGFPPGSIQCVASPSVALVQELMGSERIDVILATGGSAMVRAAYSSGNPALGVGPGNAVAYVDPSARVDAAARALVESKSFDNSVLCTNESIVLALEENRGNLERALRSAGAHVCTEDETERLRDYLFGTGAAGPGSADVRRFNVEATGQAAPWIAERAGFRVAPSAKVLVPVVPRPGQDDPLLREKLCPVLTLSAAVDFAQALAVARQATSHGAGHSAAFHGENRERLLAFAETLPVYRVVVNAPCSQGAAGFATHLPPSFMIGTGYAGRSSVGENVGPQHLVHWTRVAAGRDADGPALEAADLAHGALRRETPPAPTVPPGGIVSSAGRDGAARVADARSGPAGSGTPARVADATDGGSAIDRDELRRLILEELRSLRSESR